MQINMTTLRSPAFIFIVYVIAASFFIMVFRFIFPGEVSPLPIFAQDWRLVRGLLTIIALYPALAFSALVIPFGIPSEEDMYTKYSAQLFQRMISPLTTAIGATAVYALLFFLVLPFAQNHEDNLRFQGEMYRMARDQAMEHGRAGEWLEASQLIGIADSVWEASPELDDLRAEVEARLSDPRTIDRLYASDDSSSALREPLNAVEAIMQAEAALNERRWFDAHWLATLGGHLAREGSPETSRAAMLAARAWNQIQSQQPSPGDIRAHELYRQKMDGYLAMQSKEWIRAFYIFRELLELTPHDPDARNFYAVSEEETKKVAFFIDEMQVTPGETLTSVLFSLPWESTQSGRQNRLVMRIGSLSASPDVAYGFGIEYMVFDANANLLFSLEAPYAKFLPITLDGQHKVLVMMRTLDRHIDNWSREPQWTAHRDGIYHPDSAQLTLEVSYETFLKLLHMRQGLPGMQMGDLFAAKDISQETGYIPQVFEAEILNRLGSCLFFLPMSVIAIVIGWNFRAKRRPRYLFVLSFPLLPLVFNAVVYLCRSVLSIIGTSLVLALHFSVAFPLFIGILALSFVLSLILLAAQHG